MGGTSCRVGTCDWRFERTRHTFKAGHNADRTIDDVVTAIERVSVGSEHGIGRMTEVRWRSMVLARSKVTAQGRISVPAEIRRKLGIGPGSVAEWELDGDKVIVRRVGRYSWEDIHRALGTLDK
jgi:AbrB family looped-hinge helix DNA binding protein